MEVGDYVKHPSAYGLISAIIAVTITFGVHQAYPAEDIKWALTAVGIASFFSGAFSAHYSQEK